MKEAQRGYPVGGGGVEGGSRLGEREKERE